MKSMTRFVAAAILLATVPPNPLAAQKPNLDGTWLFDAARTGSYDDLGRVWSSVVTVKDDRFVLTKLWGNEKDLTGRLVFDPLNAQAIDLVCDELTFPDTELKVPAATSYGLYKATADRVTICFAKKLGGKRPEKLEPTESTFFVALARAPAGFKRFPAEITVRATGPDGQPVPSAAVGTFLVSRHDPKPGEKRAWRLHDPTKTGPDGTATVKFDEPPFVVRDDKSGHIAFPAPSPARLATGELRVALVSESRISGRVALDGATSPEGLAGIAYVQLFRDGSPHGQVDLKGGGFEFPVVPGTYALKIFGPAVHTEYRTITVPEGKAEVAVGSISLKPSVLARLVGKPAPELEGVVEWTGKPVKLADLKGQYVLVDFWGYWCGGCIEVMPVLVELHEKFAGKGLAIVGVHVDAGDDVNTAAKLDAKIGPFVKKAWNGKALPFPNALVSGKSVGAGDDRGPVGAPKQYGIEVYPTTILIDPEGKVVGRFRAHDIKTATGEIEKLLGTKK